MSDQSNQSPQPIEEQPASNPYSSFPQEETKGNGNEKLVLDLRSPNQNPPPNKSRLTVIESVHHQPPDAEATTAESTWATWLVSDEQPFIRRFSLGEKWTKLDRGWVDRCGLLTVANRGIKFVAVPTEQEKDQAAEQVVEVCFGDWEPSIIIGPGQSCRFQPSCVDLIWMRCRSGQVKVSVTVFPA